MAICLSKEEFITPLPPQAVCPPEFSLFPAAPVEDIFVASEDYGTGNPSWSIKECG
jgi:hypothetical protein